MRRFLAIIGLASALALAASAFAGSAGAYPSANPATAQAHFLLLTGPWNLSYHPPGFFGYDAYWPQLP